MAAHVVRHGLRMRKTFSVEKLDIAHWFPGHMARGMNKMQQKLKSVDCIIEVHDARIPITGRNSLFEQRLGLSTLKPHIFVLNKMDLADLRDRNSIISYYESQGVKDIIFTNCKNPDSSGIKSIIPRVSKLVQKSERYNRSEESEYQMMVIGIPNVGKSSLINALRAKHTRRSKATQVGGVPGITQSVLERIKVCNNPKVYLLDTPGVMAPKINSLETGLKLALAATIKDHLVGEDIMADYLLYWLNSCGNFSYVQYLGLDEPVDNIQQLLLTAAAKNNWVRKTRDHTGVRTVPDIILSASKFIRGFRLGEFGKVMLDDLSDLKI
ncbi:mitochondrial ribosome-associated GTPase 1 [Procambarus clarkii]|uniref:mitochondrial ribosome-associated GTPase 1 n=1 Tax=Procambarus clarkii TaxID=6728 RepID=UPI003743EEA9